MLFALDESNARVRATPNARATCPVCEAEVIAKTGEVNTWHWAHRSMSDCDSWHEGETPWHLHWKNLFVGELEIEKVITRGGKKHRADLVAKNGTVVEFQYSSISPSEIREREQFYGDMTWVVYCNSWNLARRYRTGNTGQKYVTFVWKHARRSFDYCTKQVFLDLGLGNMLEVKKFHSTKYGWGYERTRKWFIEAVKS